MTFSSHGERIKPSPFSRGILSRGGGFRAPARIIPALAGNTHPWPPLNATSRDHPRSRGEYSVALLTTSTISGSSPLSRGIHERQSRGLLRLRIIPALAGNTGPAPTALPPLTDHPRSRGEYAACSKPIDRSAGSSPLSRGILSSAPCCEFGQRIIPALAGNTFGESGQEREVGDHPRSRGEYVHFWD